MVVTVKTHRQPKEEVAKGRKQNDIKESAGHAERWDTSNGSVAVGRRSVLWKRTRSLRRRKSRMYHKEL